MGAIWKKLQNCKNRSSFFIFIFEGGVACGKKTVKKNVYQKMLRWLLKLVSQIYSCYNMRLCIVLRIISIKYGSSPVMPKKINYKAVEKHFLNDISIFNEVSQPLERVVGLLKNIKLYGHYCVKKGGWGQFEKREGTDPLSPPPIRPWATTTQPHTNIYIQHGISHMTLTMYYIQVIDYMPQILWTIQAALQYFIILFPFGDVSSIYQILSHI